MVQIAEKSPARPFEQKDFNVFQQLNQGILYRWRVRAFNFFEQEFCSRERVLAYLFQKLVVF